MFYEASNLSFVPNRKETSRFTDFFELASHWFDPRKEFLKRLGSGYQIRRRLVCQLFLSRPNHTILTNRGQPIARGSKRTFLHCTLSPSSQRVCHVQMTVETARYPYWRDLVKSPVTGRGAVLFRMCRSGKPILGLGTINALVATELSTSINWQETALWEIANPCDER